MPALESIREQTYTDYRCIICDASTDGSSDSLERLVSDDSRFTVIRQDKSSLSMALQEGLLAATAPLVARMDADDVALPQRFAIQVEAMRAREDMLALGSDYRYMDAKGRLGRVIRMPREALIRKTMLDGSPLAHPTAIFRRQAVLDVGGYRTLFDRAEDYDLWLRLSRRGKLDNINQVLLHYRLHSDNSVVTHAVENRRYTLLALVAHLAATKTGKDPLQEDGGLKDAMQLLAPNERVMACGRVLAGSAHLIGDATEDAEGAAWLEALQKLPRNTTVSTILAVYYMRLVKRYAIHFPGKAAVNFAKAMQANSYISMQMCSKFLLQYMRGALQ